MRRNTTLAGKASPPPFRFNRALPIGGQAWRYTGGLTVPGSVDRSQAKSNTQSSNPFNPEESQA